MKPWPRRSRCHAPDWDWIDGVVAPPTVAVNSGDFGYWSDGQPVTLIASNFTSALDVWNILTSQLTLTGSIGEFIIDRLSNIASASASVNVSAESYTLTTGNQTVGTYANTSALDTVYHTHTDSAGAMELYYQFDVGTDGVPSSAKWTGYFNIIIWGMVSIFGVM